MVRMSDIFKKHKAQSPDSRQGNPQKEEPVKNTPQQDQGAHLSSALMDSLNKADDGKSESIYNDSLLLIKSIFSDSKNIDIGKVVSQVDKTAGQLLVGNNAILMLASSRNSTEDNYIFCHSINVAIYALKLGVEFGFDKQKLTELGVSAFLHDLGMLKCFDVVMQPRKLTADEYENIKEHTLEGSRHIEGLEGFGKIAGLVALQHHERIDGSGYPTGLKGDAIHEYAKIVGICDVYEAMMHQRSYSSKETMELIIDQKQKFDYKIIKTLIEQIGIFPLGSMVQLNTRELAMVVKINQSFPLRPGVKVLYDSQGNALKDERLIDLSKQPTVYISGGVKKKED